MSASARPWSLGPCLALTFVYASVATKHLLGGDNAEFVTVAAAGGVAHPPGYPLYVLWLRAFSWLPAQSPVHRASLATALCGGAALALLARATRAWGASEAGASVAVIVFGASGLAIRLASAAEVFMLNAALVAAIVLVAAPRGPLRGGRRTVVLALLSGLALSNHHSAVFAAPIGLWGAIAGLLETSWRGGVALLAMVALLLGLSPYVLLVMDASRASPQALVWGDTGTAGGLWHHVSRGDFGSASLGMGGMPAAPWPNFMFLLRSLGRQTHVLPVIMAVLGGVAVVRRDPRPGALLVFATLLAGPLFVLRFNIPLVGLGPSVVERFHLLPMLLLTILAGVGVTPLLGDLPRAPYSTAALLGVVLAASVAVALPAVAQEHQPTVENYLRDTLTTAPSGSIVMGSGDHRTFGFAYLQAVLHERADVDYVDESLLLYPWYRRRVKARIGLDFVDGAGELDPGVIAPRLLSRGRPFLLTNLQHAGIVRGLQVYPRGTLVRVLPQGEQEPAPSELERLNVDVFATLHASPAAPPGTWAFDVRADYARAWLMIAAAQQREGNRQGAARSRARAAVFEQTP